MRKQFITLMLALVLSFVCAAPAFAITFTQYDPVTGEIIKQQTEEDAAIENKAQGEKKLQEWLELTNSEIEKNTGGDIGVRAVKDSFIVGNSTSAESYGYIGEYYDGYTNDEFAEAEKNGVTLSYQMGKNAMFYLKDNVLVITGSGYVHRQSIEVPTGHFALNEHIEAIIIGPGIISAGAIGANLPNLKAVITMDVNTNIALSFSNTGGYLPGYWPNASTTRRVIMGAGLNFESFNGEFDYTRMLGVGTRPAGGAVPTMPLKDTVMIAPNYTYKANQYRDFYHPEVVLPEGLSYEELVSRARELLAHGNNGEEFPEAMYDFLPVELGGTGKIKLEPGKFYLGENQNSGSTDNGAATGSIGSTDTATKMSAWAEADVTAAIERGIVPVETLGVDYTRNITRGQFAELMVRFLRTENGCDVNQPLTQSSAVFADGTSQAMADLREYNVIGGYNNAENNSDINMGIHDPLTREQAATMLYRLFGQATDHADLWGNNPGVSPFTDKISDWAAQGVNACWTAGLVGGYDAATFGALDNITIEQAIIIMYRSYEKTGVSI